jgi:hypothetical protein
MNLSIICEIISLCHIWSASGLTSTSTPQIGIHCCHYLESRSDLRVFSNWCPFQILRYIADLLFWIRAYVSDVIGRPFVKVRNGYRFENLKKRLRSEVHMSVTWKSDMELWIGSRLEIGRRSESYITNTNIYDKYLRFSLLLVY